MRILFVIVAAAVIIGPWLSTAALAQSTSAAPASPQAPSGASPNDIDGARIFGTACGFCHQNGGRAAGRGPKLSKSERSDEFIIERIRKGKTGSMPGFAAVYNDAQIAAMLAYIRGLND